MARVTIRYWAAAKAAAGCAEELLDGAAVADLLATAARRHGPRLGSVLACSSVLVDGRRAAPELVLEDGVVVEVLPPFAGG